MRSASVVIDAGAEVTTVWSAWRGTTSHPSVVAVDARGVVKAHGRAALLAVARRSDDLMTRRPFAAGDVADQFLARSFLRWLLAESGHRARKCVILFPLPTSTSEEIASHWRQLANAIGGPPVIADRPTALVLGLGLVGADRAHLVVEVTSDWIEIGVVARGAVVIDHLVPGEPDSWASLVAVVASLLHHLDPDDELDIREEGIHLVARTPESEMLAHLLADGLGLAVLVTETDCNPVILGARMILETNLRYANA